MNSLDTFSQATKQLHTLPAETSLIILHPDFYGQHRLFAPIMREEGKTIVFVAVPQPDCTLADFLPLVAHAVQDQLGNTLGQLPGAADAAAKTVADSLNGQGNVTLIIDAFDLTVQAETAPFIVALAQQLSNGCRIILGGRELPMQVIEQDTLTDHMALIPVNPDKMILDYAKTGEKEILEVRALGPGRVLINGRLVEQWDGVLPRTLFFYFVDRGMTTRDEIFQTFWPNLSTREATNVFHVTKRKISEILGADLTVYWSGFYRISPELELHYDVIKFAEAVQNAAVASDDEAVDLFQNAVALYNGPFLSHMEQGWATNRRDELASNYAEALAGLARIYMHRGQHTHALGYYLRAAATSPDREDLARAIMDLYHTLGKPEDALATFERLEAQLRKSLNVSPGPQTIELAETIRAAM